MMPRALRRVASDECRIDTKIDRGRCLTITKGTAARTSIKVGGAAQHLTTGGARCAADSKWEEITHKAFGHPITHQGAKATAKLVVFRVGPRRVSKQTGRRKSRSASYPPGNPDFQCSEKGLDRAPPIILQRKCRIDLPHQRRLVFERPFLDSYNPERVNDSETAGSRD